MGAFTGVFALLAGLALVSTATASPIVVVVNFETVPPEPTGPSLFGQPEQNITVPGVATFGGGTILGNATNFPGIIYATPPNTYATSDFGGLPETLTITVDPTFTASEVSFPIFNGETFAQSYVATAFDGATQVAQQTFLNVPANTSSGYVLADLTASDITSVTVTPVSSPATFDFLIDTVAFNEPVTAAVTPEPSSVILLGSGVLVLGLAGFVRRRLSKSN